MYQTFLICTDGSEVAQKARTRQSHLEEIAGDFC